MSATRDHGEIVFHCDGADCDEFLETGMTEFHDAVAEKRAAGWSSRKDPHDKWEDVCKDCKS